MTTATNNSVGDSPSENIKVYLRIRPFVDRENNSVNDTKSTSIIQLHLPDTDGRRTGNNPDDATMTTVRILDGASRFIGASSSDPGEIFTFDAVGGPETEQETVFVQVVRPIADNCLLGYNGTVFAYGQTGSGKTFTMQGPTNEDGSIEYARRGIIPRTFDFLFERMREEERRSNDALSFTCRISYVEIYNELAYDLLDTAGTLCSLREDPKRGVWVEGCREERVCEAGEALRLFEEGSRNRHVAETAMNRESSRSHCVFTLILTSKKVEGALVDVRESRFNLVDLAGSERQQLTATVGARLKEAGNINKSLLALSNVINALVDIANGKSRHVHYRDSKLTFLLRDSLGGNAKTLIIAAVSPSPLCQAETLSTLRFAQRAKQIRNKAIVNKDIQGNVLELQAEVRRLRHENLRLLRARDGSSNESDNHGDPGFEHEDDHSGVNALMKLEITAHAHDGDDLIWTIYWERLQAMHKETERLKRLLESSQHLVQRREEQLKSEKMIAKFREASIATLEAELAKRLGGGENAEASGLHEVFKGERARLKAEIGELRRAVDNHPEVTKYAHELMRARQRLATLTDPAMASEQIERLHRYAEELWAKLAQLEQEHRGNNKTMAVTETADRTGAKDETRANVEAEAEAKDDIPTTVIAPNVRKLLQERRDMEDRYESLVQEMELLRAELAEGSRETAAMTKTPINAQIECDSLGEEMMHAGKDKKRRVKGHGESKDSLAMAMLEEQLARLQREKQETELLLEKSAKREEELAAAIGQREKTLLLAQQKEHDMLRERDTLIAQQQQQQKEQEYAMVHQRNELAAEATLLKEALAKTRQQMETARTDLDRLRNELRAASERVAQYEQACAGLSPAGLAIRLAECNGLEKRLEGVEEQLQETIREKEHIHERLQQLGPLTEQLTVAQETIRELHEELDGVRQELVRLRHENDKLVQHGNIKQKLQYHVTIKEENNAFREEIRQLREELTRLRQRNIELDDQLHHGGIHHHNDKSTML